MSGENKFQMPRAMDENQETDYSMLPENDFDTLPHDTVDVRSMTDQDLPALKRIDRQLTGLDRADYINAKLTEAMNDSAVRVSLTARIDEAPAGFLMARIDSGDFGHVEPVAVIDTMDVSPDFAGHGVGEALLSQLMTNLAGLRIEKVETTLAVDNLDLLGFFYRFGFLPSQRIALHKKVR
jgi:ribosomal protein S18 acetylase RimI-like enzyme